MKRVKSFLDSFYFIYEPNYVFSQKFMKKILLLTVFALVSCKRNTVAHPPVGGVLSQNDLDISKNRIKNLNAIERQQIESWIQENKETFYPTNLNYWTNIKDFDKREKKPNETLISYSYEIYDFDKTKVYDKPKERLNVRFGHFEEIIAVENALRYINENEEVTLLVPSSLAFGTYGDEDKIDNDIPLIIKLKVL